GIDLAMFDHALGSSKRAQLGLSDTVVIGYMGRLVEEKGLETLMHAVACLRAHSPSLDFRVIIIGSGPAEQKLKAIAASAKLRDTVTFMGSVPHSAAGQYMACLDVFVLPSRTMRHWK